MKKVLFVGGGSIGHIAPAVAVWRALKELHPEAEAHFVCSTRGEDALFLERELLSFTAIDAPRLALSFSNGLSWGFPWKFLKTYRHACTILNSFQPNVIFSKGGYVSVPLCLAAHRRGITIILHESDVVSGYANRLVFKWAKGICLGFPQKEVGPKCVVTGNPIRPEVTEGSREEGLRITGFGGERPILLVIGGSQGAQALNEAIAKNIDALTTLCDVIHITGRGKAIIPEGHPGYWSREFVVEELHHLYSISDLALSRASASVISELAANGIPVILVPLRGVGHDHQYYNAVSATETGGCRLIDQKYLDDELLLHIKELTSGKELRETMSKSIEKLHNPDAARQIAEIISKTLD